MAAYALIAEFDRQRAELYREVLDTHRLESVIVRDGIAAARVLRTRGAPQLLLTDLSLPHSDGFALIRELRQLSSPEKSAVVVCSAFAELRSAAWSLRTTLGIAEVADKNLSSDALGRLVTRALATVTREGALQTDPSEREAFIRRTLHRIGQTFRVPIVLLQLELRDERKLVACMTVNELQGSARRWPILQQVMTTREPLVIPDLARQALFGIGPITPTLSIRGFAAAPLVTSTGHMLGAMALLDFEPLTLAADQMDLLLKAARRVSDELAKQYREEFATVETLDLVRSEEQWAALERLALTDPLTGLSNRRAGERALAREIARARRSGNPFSIALLDVDRFKEINDTHGHAVGDDVLREVSRILTSSFRASDLAIRWGGDEFLILLPDVSLDGAIVFAERARAQVEALPDPGGSVTLSAGIVQVGPKEDAREAIARADAKLYEAKGEGRNRVKGGED